MNKKLTVLPASRRTARSTPIVLRETKTTRLVFKPLLVDNINTPEAAVRGEFIFQKKKPSNEWEDYDIMPLSHLRDKEWVKLEIHASELLHFHNELNSLYKLYQETGVPQKKIHLLKISSHLEGLLKVEEDSLVQFLMANDKLGIDLLLRLLNWVIQTENPQRVIDKLEKLHTNNVKQLNTLIGLSILKKSLQTWEENEENSDEDFWQMTFTNYSFIPQGKLL